MRSFSAANLTASPRVVRFVCFSFRVEQLVRMGSVSQADLGGPGGPAPEGKKEEMDEDGLGPVVPRKKKLGPMLSGVGGARPGSRMSMASPRQPPPSAKEAPVGKLEGHVW